MTSSKDNLTYRLSRSGGTRTDRHDEGQRDGNGTSLKEDNKPFIVHTEDGRIGPDVFFGSFPNLTTEVVDLTTVFISSVSPI